MLKRLWTVVTVVVLAEGLAATVAIAENNYGAIATSESTSVYGFSYDYSTRAEAQRKALKECASRAHDCQVQVWFKNGCAAVADNPYYIAWGLGTSRASAESKALRKLQGDGKIVAWACTTR